MNQTLYITIGLVALGMTTGVIWGGRQQTLTSEAGLLGGVASMALWAIFALASYNVEIVTETGTVVQSEYQSLAILGLAGGIIAFLAVVEAGFAQLEEADY
jgi:hypothetical protein